jgi:Concanavalin A-like lectin/glucanases superfamily
MNKSGIRTIVGGLAALLMAAGTAAAQYQPIPNFTGVGAGYNFRQAINQRFSGAQAISPTIVSLPFTSLPTEHDGTILWCNDCADTTPCTGGGAGAFAKGTRGVWACAADTLEQDLNANWRDIANASSVAVEKSGDANPREQLAAGTGLLVSNGTAAPSTAIDENDNITGHVNGVINVRATPYLAKGDGNTDDQPAIQAAYNAAANASGFNGQAKPSIYLPATPNSCYSLNEPLLLWGSVNVHGAGPSSTYLCPQFWGPDIIQQWNKGFVAPLIANVTAAWQASHSYTAYNEIADPNGKIEYVSTAGTSGATAPTWCTTGLGCTTTDGTVTWTQGPATSGGLLSGSGSAWDDSQVANAFSGITQGLDLEWDSAVNLNGLSALTIEFAVDPIFIGGGNPGALFCTRPTQPESSGTPAACITLSFSPFNLNASLDIGGSSVSVNSTTPLPTNQIDDIALTYDGSAVRLYLNGTMIGSTSATGNIVEPYYERMLYPAGDGATQTVSPGGYYGSLRVSNVARYTGSSYTPTTAKFTSDGNTLLLLNFPVPPTLGQGQAGYIEGTDGAYGNMAVYFPIESSQNTQTGGHLSGFDYCNGGQFPGGLYATWVIDAVWENLSCAGASYIGFDLADNDYQDMVRNVFVSVNYPGVKAARTPINFYFGNQSNNNAYENLQADGGARTSYMQSGGYGTYINDRMTGRGYAVYPFVNKGGAGDYITPFTDIEDSEADFISSFYFSGLWAPTEITGAEMLAPGASTNPGDSFFTLDGGQPPVVIGGSYGGSVAEVADVASNPSAPMTIREASLPKNVPLTNSGKASEVYASVGGVSTGITVSSGVDFANLPNPVINGASFYCPDCDPPVNPPVACSSSGAKTGSWVHGLNNGWICTP